jgi:hypothetical protein
LLYDFVLALGAAARLPSRMTAISSTVFRLPMAAALKVHLLHHHRGTNDETLTL